MAIFPNNTYTNLMNRYDERAKLIQQIHEQKEIIEACQKLMIRHNLTQSIINEEDDTKMTIAFNKLADARKTMIELKDRLNRLDHE